MAARPPLRANSACQKSYVATLASEPNNHYMYMLSVPNEKSKKQTLIKIDTNDRLLSAETPLNSAVPLKDGRDLGDYYITAAAFSGDMLYAYSKNYNTLMQINKDSAKVLKAYGMPDVGDVMSMEIVDEKLYLLSKNQSQDENFHTKYARVIKIRHEFGGFDTFYTKKV